MTVATDRALAAMNAEMARYRYWHRAETVTLPANLLDAVPADVLALLAAERGALELVVVAAHDWALELLDGTEIPAATTLYRITEEITT